MYAETPERKTVIEILEFLLDKKVLKIESIDGMDEHFHNMENILKKYQSAKAIEWREWLKFWAQVIHKSHITPVMGDKNIENCTTDVCLSVQETLHDLGQI